MKCFPLFACLLAFFAAAGGAHGQSALPIVPGQGIPSQYVRAQWGKAEGLPQSSITSVLQTRSGYVWLGTQEGLVRFDGHRFVVHLVAQHPGLPSNDITTLFEDARGQLWVGTSRGLARYDGTTFTAVPAIGDTFVREVIEDSERLWVGTFDGLFSLKDGVALAYHESDGLPAARVLSLALDARRRLWVGTPRGAARLDGKRFKRAEGLPDSEVRALHLTPEGRLLAGTSNGMAVLWGDAFTPFAPQGAQVCASVNDFATDAAGTLWVGSQAGGLCGLINGTFYPLSSGKPAESNVLALAGDAEGGLWVGMQAGGLMRLHRGRFLTFGATEGLATDAVLTVLESRDGALWVGTDGGGLDRVADGAITHYGREEGLEDGMIMSLLETHDGTMWAGVYDGGFCRLEGRRFRCFTTRDGLLNNFVFALHESQDGSLWIGTDLGLNRLRNGQIEDLSPLAPILAGASVRALQPHRGALWVGTYGAGIVRIQGGNARAFGLAEGLPVLNVLTLEEDENGTLWAGLDEGGLCRLERDGDRFRCYGTAEGLFDNRVLQILSDGEGYLWLGSNQGIVRMRLDGFPTYDAGRQSRLFAERVGTSLSDGLRDPEVNGGLQPTVWRGAGGTLYFGTVGGVAIVTPGAFETYRNRLPPRVLIEEVRAGGIPVVGVNPVLQPRQRDVRFTFTALSFQNPDSVRIRFRLRGHDEAWHDLEGEDRIYTYANLNHGSYVFEVQAANADGVWNETGDSYAFEVQPHLFELWWFYLLCALAAIGVSTAVSRVRVRHLQRRQQELEKVVEERTVELRAHEAELKRVNEGLEQEVQRQLDVLLEERRRYEGELISARDKAEESARLKSAILNNMSHEIRTPISAILGFSDILSMEVKGDLREFVQYIEDNGKRLLNTLNGLLDLSRIESEGVVLQAEPFDAALAVRSAADMLAPLAIHQQLGFDVSVPAELPVVTDPFGFERIATNLISNAIKFTEQGSIEVSMVEEEDDFVLTVRDTGIGIAEDFIPHLFEPFKQESGGLSRSHEGAGLGLALVHNYVEAMGGVVSVQSAKGYGTTFTVRLPRVAAAEPVLSGAE